MKKLMIAAAIVCAAALSQAATVSWGVKSVMTPTKTTGIYTSDGVGSDATFAVYLVSESVFSSTSLDAIYDYTKTHAADFKGATSMSNKTLTSGDTYGSGDKVYALELITYSDANGDWYVANKSWVQIAELDGVAQNASVTKINDTIGGETDAKSFDGSGVAITGWTAVPSDVPEPTSGLLLLLGVAGLALRRKQK